MPLPPPEVPKKLLIAGLIMTMLPQTFLYLLKKSEDEPPAIEEGQESIPVEQFVEGYAQNNLFLEGLLWTIFVSGIICLIITFKKTLPNPEDKLFEEEWDKKGR